MRANFRIAAVILLLCAAIATPAQNGEQFADDPIDTRIPRILKIYIAPADGFEQ